MYRLLLVLPLAAALLVAPPAFAAKVETKALIQRCAELAASPDDPLTPTGHGVALTSLQSDEAIEACTPASEAQSARSVYHLGRAYDAAGEYNKARTAYQEAADAGYALALVELGALYSFGLGVEADPERAQALYLKAYEEAQLPIAAFNIAFSYHFGEGVAVDYPKAIEYYELALAGGNVTAANQLGVLYETGLGVEADTAKAAQYYQVAVDGGNSIAMNNLAVLIENGRSGDGRGMQDAVALYRRAADLDYGWAQVNLADIIMSDDRAEARLLLTAALDDAVPEAAAAAHNDLAWSYAMEGTDLAYGEELAIRAVELEAEHASYQDTLAWIRHLQGKNQEALEPARAAVEYSSKDEAALWVYHAHLGDVLAALGDSKAADKSYRQAVALAPADANDETVDLTAIRQRLSR